MNTLLLSVYRYIVMPLVVTALPFAAIFNRKLRAGLKLRRQRVEPILSSADPIWIHASSGEFEYAKAVIRQLKEDKPQTPILVTYFSPTYSKAATSFPGVDRAVALPLDLPGPCSAFLKKYHPQMCLIARTDLWPEMLEQCRKRKIPVILFSYTQKKIKHWAKRFFTRWTLHWIQKIYCVSQADLENLKEASSTIPAEVMGDTRYDQVAFRLNHPKAIPTGVLPKDKVPCLVAGSSWPEDEAVLFQGLSGLLLKKSLRLILVPHEPTREHLNDVEKQLGKFGLSYAYYSNSNWDHEHVLIVDQVGVLAELYAHGQFAFIGGSFRKSVHSVMEALGAGLITFVGPFHENNREAMEFKSLPLGNHTGLNIVETAEDLRDKISGWIERPEQIGNFSHALKIEFAQRLGASERLVKGLPES